MIIFKDLSKDMQDLVKTNRTNFREIRISVHLKCAFSERQKTPIKSRVTWHFKTYEQVKMHFYYFKPIHGTFKIRKAGRAFSRLLDLVEAHIS